MAQIFPPVKFDWIMYSLDLPCVNFPNCKPHCQMSSTPPHSLGWNVIWPVLIFRCWAGSLYQGVVLDSSLQICNLTGIMEISGYLEMICHKRFRQVGENPNSKTHKKLLRGCQWWQKKRNVMQMLFRLSVDRHSCFCVYMSLLPSHNSLLKSS